VRLPKLSKLEHQIMDALWSRGASSVREILEAFPEKDRPAYTTVQTMVYRLEDKGAIRRVKKIGNAHIFDAAISRASAQRRLIDELLAFFGGSSQPVVAHLIESGNLTLDDVKEAEQLLIKLKSGRSGRSGKSGRSGSSERVDSK
jgi:predicted transcriptional regulator